MMPESLDRPSHVITNARLIVVLESVSASRLRSPSSLAGSKYEGKSTEALPERINKYMCSFTASHLGLLGLKKAAD